MTPENARVLLQKETERIEWKESLSDTNKVFQSVCAMANDLSASGQPGFLIIGVNDRGVPIGVNRAAIDAEQKRLSSWVTSVKLQPHPSVDIHVVEIDAVLVLVVAVHPYATPPEVTVNRTCWVRKGATTIRATEADVLRLRERRPAHQRPFDTRLHPLATQDDLRLTLFREQHLQGRQADDAPDTFPSFERWLTSHELGADDVGTWRPNHAAVLIHGVSPQSFIDGASVELVRYGGTEIDAPVVDRKLATGTLPDQLEVCYAWLRHHTSQKPKPADNAIVTAYAPQYPEKALLELARNMVQHRTYEGTNAPSRIEWYDDRIEFSNPGNPFGRASEGEFGTHADYRNPLITKLLVDGGYVERLGRGVRLVRKYLADAELPPLVVDVNGFTRVTVKARS